LNCILDGETYAIDTADTNNLPTLSIVTIVFNDRGEIAKTIDSVLAQDYPNIEYVVIDGESTDGTKGIIQQYEDKLDIFVCERDEGVYDAMNKAVARATGEFILFMNCGDVFASTDAVSSAMRFVQPRGDQILFGRWLRRTSDESLIHCHPLLEKGLFNHQAVIYSRCIHAWHGGYVNVDGLTTADYLFFATLFNSTAVTCRIIKTTIAIIDVNGLSAGPQTFSQKYAIDFICGRISKVRLLMALIVHPIYRQAKALFRWRR
jgi:glycosyltransferase involved in cell wall biosynthesis